MAGGRAQGLACASDYGTTVAAVAEVSVDEQTGKIRVHHITSAMDCGLVINPDGAKAQMEGNTMWGVSATLQEEVRIEDGRVALNNFETYPLLTMKEAPTVEAILVDTADRNRRAWASRQSVRLARRLPMRCFRLRASGCGGCH